MNTALLIVCVSCTMLSNSYAYSCDKNMPKEIINPCKCQGDNENSNKMICEGDMITDESMEKISKNFKGYDELNRLRLEDTRLKTLDFTRFSFASSVRWISIVNNSLLQHIDFTLFHPYTDFIEIDQCKAFREASIFNAINFRYHELEKLKVHGTKINRIPDYAFYNRTMSRLTTIDFQYNPISSVGKKAFYSLDDIKLIDLSHNQISYIDDEAFSFNIDVHSQNVLTIDLRDNLLLSNSFLNTSFSNIRRPVALLFGNNNLTSLKEDIFKPLLKEFALTKLDLRDNTFICDCSAKWIIQLPDDIQEKILFMKCQDGRNIFDFKVNDFKKCN